MMKVSKSNKSRSSATTAERISNKYQDFNRDGWEYFFENIINPIIVQQKITKRGFDNQSFQKVRLGLKKHEFPQDISVFISFLGGDGFFKYYNLSVEDWLLSKNFCNPNKLDELPYSISQAMDMPLGENYIRSQLMNLTWWRSR